MSGVLSGVNREESGLPTWFGANRGLIREDTGGYGRIREDTGGTGLISGALSGLSAAFGCVRPTFLGREVNYRPLYREHRLLCRLCSGLTGVLSGQSAAFGHFFFKIIIFIKKRKCARTCDILRPIVAFLRFFHFSPDCSRTSPIGRIIGFSETGV